MERDWKMAKNPAKAPTGIHRLTADDFLNAGDGSHPDGGGLTLVRRGTASSWTFSYTSPTGKRRELGLGAARRPVLPTERKPSAQELSAARAAARRELDAARVAAARMREHLAAGRDPLDVKKAEREAAERAEAERKAQRQRETWTLARAARDYHARVIEPTRTAKHAAQWIASLENHVPPPIWHAPIAEISAPGLLSALLDVKPHERARRHTGDTVPETLRRIRQRLDAVFEDAIFHGRATTNPAAAIRRKLQESGKSHKAKGKFAALPFKEAPALMAQLRQAEGTAARALEFAVLCAARTGEVLGAEWHEINFAEATWTVPASRMKAKEEHVVFLSERAIAILEAQRGQDSRYVFPSPVTIDKPDGERKPLSNMSMLAVLDRLGVRYRTTVHGLCRATFSTWANETGAARPDVIEATLAHREGDRVRASYNRSEFTAERRALLAKWSRFLQGAQVVALRGAA